jgi:hypothetical protein
MRGGSRIRIYARRRELQRVRANHQETITAMDFLPISRGCCATAVTYGAPRDLFRSVREEEGKLSSGTQTSVIARDQAVLVSVGWAAEVGCPRMTDNRAHPAVLWRKKGKK